MIAARHFKYVSRKRLHKERDFFERLARKRTYLETLVLGRQRYLHYERKMYEEHFAFSFSN